MKYLGIEELIILHNDIMESMNGLKGYNPAQIDYLDSALTHIQNDELYSSFLDKLTHLIFSCVKFHPFLDGNKRAAVIFANHYLIAHGGGILVIPEKEVPEFKGLLIRYYEGEDIAVIGTFMKERCWKTMGT